LCFRFCGHTLPHVSLGLARWNRDSQTLMKSPATLTKTEMNAQHSQSNTPGKYRLHKCLAMWASFLIFFSVCVVRIEKWLFGLSRTKVILKFKIIKRDEQFYLLELHYIRNKNYYYY
jgi:hypothetical protein